MNRATRAALAAEAIGTFLFFFVGMGSVVINTYLANTNQAPPGLLSVALANGLVLAVLVSAFGAVSGAHFNPAVTLAVWIAGRIGWLRAVLYVLAQLVGAAAAGFLIRGLMSSEDWGPSKIGIPTLGPGIGSGVGIAIEAILTLVLVFAVLGTAIDPRGPRIGGMAIGLAIACDTLFGGPLTGAAMNPARWFGPALATGTWDSGYVWIAGPLAGAAIAAVVYRFLLAPPSSPAAAPTLT